MSAREFAAAIEHLYAHQAGVIALQFRKVLADKAPQASVSFERVRNELHIEIAMGGNKLDHVIKLDTLTWCGEHVPRKTYPSCSVVSVAEKTMHLAVAETKTHPMSGSGHWQLLGCVPEPEPA